MLKKILIYVGNKNNKLSEINKWPVLKKKREN